MKIRKATKKDILDVLKLVKQITDYHCQIDKLYKPYKEYRRLKEHLEEKHINFFALEDCLKENQRATLSTYFKLQNI